jgi:hypothetical protein
VMPRAKSPLKARLEDWHLKKVPFPAVPFVDYFNADPLQNGSVFAPDLRAAEIECIRRDILRNGFAGMVRRWSWMWARRQMGGSLGMGKTALLTYLADQINRDYGTSFFNMPANWLVIYVPIQPRAKSIGELAAAALASVCSDARGISVERLLVSRVRRKLVLNDPNRRHPDSMRRAPESRFADDTWLRANGVDLDMLNAQVERDLRSHGLKQKIARAFATLSLRDFLINLNGDQANLFSPQPGFAAQALNLLLDDIAQVVQAAQVTHTTVILDSFYYLVRNTKLVDKPKLAAQLRELAVDGPYVSVRRNLYNWVAVMHTTTAPTFNNAWESCDMHKQAPLLYDAKTSVTLPPLQWVEGRRLLEAYLGYQRREPYKLTPYTPESLDMIVRIAGEQTHAAAGTCEPRTLLQAAFEVTCEALLANPDPAPITPAFVEAVLTGKPLPQNVIAVDTDDDVAPSEQDAVLAVACPCECHADEDSEVRDAVALLSGATSQDETQTVMGYRCRSCNTPVEV